MNDVQKRSLTALLAITVVIAGCSRQPEAPAGEPPAAQAAAPEAGVQLDAGQGALIGLETADLKSAPLEQTTTGQATVMPHESLAQSLAEIRAAQLTVAQSDAALRRLQGLEATPGAMGAESLEAARRQAGVDAAQLQLAQRRQQALFGNLAQAVPASVVEALGDGRSKLVRVLFPADVPEHPAAGSVSLGAPEDASTAPRWKVGALWTAPSEAGMPGRSFFAVVNDAQLSEGRRLLAFYSRRLQQIGVLVPAGALVTHDSKYWCYVQVGEGRFERRQIDISHPVATGYVVAEGLKAGEKVVTQGAGVLLAREQGSAEGED